MTVTGNRLELTQAMLQKLGPRQPHLGEIVGTALLQLYDGVSCGFSSYDHMAVPFLHGVFSNMRSFLLGTVRLGRLPTSTSRMLFRELLLYCSIPRTARWNAYIARLHSTLLFAKRVV